MQALARQFNLSEATFLLPSHAAASCLRIFTTNTELPFAGHPTLGSAHVVRQLHNCGNRFRLEMLGGIAPVVADGDRQTLTDRYFMHRQSTRAKISEPSRRAPTWVDG